MVLPLSFSYFFLSFQGLCPSPHIGVLWKGGVIWQECHFASCVQSSHSTGYCELCSHQLEEEQQTALCCQWVSRSSDQCWVLGYWQSCGSNSKSSRWWDPPFWPGCLWKHVSRGPHVCTNQNLASLAPQSEHNPKTICYLFCLGCLSLTSFGDV